LIEAILALSFVFDMSDRPFADQERFARWLTKQGRGQPRSINEASICLNIGLFLYRPDKPPIQAPCLEGISCRPRQNLPGAVRRAFKSQ
jgi:hypothetical protein